jgi:hypothetical protein
MNKPAMKIKENDVKLIKKVAADKTKLQIKKDAGTKLETVKTQGLACAPLGVM